MRKCIYYLAVLLSMTYLFSCFNDSHPEVGNPEVVKVWYGYQGNNSIRLVNTSLPPEMLTNSDSLVKLMGNLYGYVQSSFRNVNNKNIYIFFYNGNAPTDIPVPANQEGTLGLAMDFVEKSKPFATFTIMGENEVDMHFGFYGD